MKIRMYIDLYPGIDPARHAVFATNQPLPKADTNKRIAFTVEIPDSILYQIDGEAAGTSVVEELK